MDINHEYVKEFDLAMSYIQNFHEIDDEFINVINWGKSKNYEDVEDKYVGGYDSDHDDFFYEMIRQRKKIIIEKYNIKEEYFDDYLSFKTNIFGGSASLLDRTIMIVYAFSIGNIKAFKYFHENEDSYPFDFTRFLIENNMKSNLDREITDILCNEYIKRIEKNNKDINSFMNLFTICYYNNIEVDKNIPIQITHDYFLYQYFIDVGFIKKFYDFTKNGKHIAKVIAEKIVHQLIDEKYFKECCNIFEEFEDIRYLYKVIFSKGKYNYTIIPMEIICEMSCSKLLKLKDNSLVYFLKLEMLLKLEHMENYYDFLTLNRNLLCESEDKRIGKYLNNIL